MLAGKMKFLQSRNAPREAVADRVLAMEEAERLTGPGGRVTLADAIAATMQSVESTRKPGTVRFYRDHFRAITRIIKDDVPLVMVTHEVLQRYVAVRGQAVSAATVKSDRLTLSRLFSEAVKRGWVRASPLKLVDWPTPEDPIPDVLSWEEMVQVIDRIPADRPWQRAVFVFMARSGHRLAEMARARVEHIDLDRMVLDIDGKRGLRRVPLDEDAVPAARVLLEHAPGPWLIPSDRDSEAARKNKLISVFRLVARHNGDDKRIHPHTLRHTLATALLMAGVDLKTVADRLGHRTVRTTERYLHFVQTRMRAAGKTLGNLSVDH